MAGLKTLRTMLARLLNRPSVVTRLTGADRNVLVGRDAKNSQFFAGDVHIHAPPPAAPSPLHQLPADVADFALPAARRRWKSYWSC